MTTETISAGEFSPELASTLALKMLAAAQHRQWAFVLAGLLVVAAYVVSQFGAAFARARGWLNVVAALESDAGKLAIVFTGSLGAALAATLASGTSFSEPIFISAIAVALKAIGGFQVLKKAFAPLLLKLLRIGTAMAVLMAVVVLVPTRANACPVYTVTHGLSGTFERVDFLATPASVEKVSIAAGYSYNLNFLPNSDCTVHWISLMGALQIGGGQSATSSAPAFTLTPLAGVGLYNGMLRVLIGYDFLNVGLDASGLFTGKFAPGNLALFVGSGLNFDLDTLVAESTPPQPKAAGFVRP